MPELGKYHSKINVKLDGLEKYMSSNMNNKFQ